MPVKPSVYIGDTFTTNEGCAAIVIEYLSSYKVLVEFNDQYKHRKWVRADDLRKGAVKNPHHPSKFGIGCIGVGKHKVKVNGKLTIAYVVWGNMLQRCYYEKSLLRNPTYIGIKVCNKWLNFQVFADWFENSNYRDVWSLDKDILKKGNKLYCPEYCSFVPPQINSLLTGCNASRGEYPIGVSYSVRDCVYTATCNDGHGEFVWLGRYATPDEAFVVYKHYKEKIIKEVANEYIDDLDPRVYDALVNYEVNIND